MSPKTLDSSHAIESCTIHLHNWRPFHQLPATFKTLDTEPYSSPKPYPSSSIASGNGCHHVKRPCLSDRMTSFSIDAIDMSRLSLFDDDRSVISANKRERFLWMARKRRRHGSRSVSGRSSDRSGTRRRCCSVGASAAYGTCSDFPVAVGTDSSGELFGNGDASWASDASEAARNLRRERDGGGGERESQGAAAGLGLMGNLDNQGNDSGYGSEPGYRGDAEFGYGDEIDEEEDDQRILFWGQKLGAEMSSPHPHHPNPDAGMEMVCESAPQKGHHRCRRKKHDLRMVGALRS